MAETQGRGDRLDEMQVERAAKYARENGGSEASIDAAARRILHDATPAAKDAIRERIRQLFGG